MIERYRELNERVERARRARSTQRFGDGTYRPIVLLRAHHEPPTVFRYYRAADLCYVSSLHDGMNLVAKEFVAARDDERGVLVLSQFTGAARELTEALIVNPYDLDEASAALAAALRDVRRRAARAHALDARASSSEFNVYRWAGRMLVDAAELRRSERLTGRLSSLLTLRGAATRHESTCSRARTASCSTQLAWSNVLLAFDFDGTLAPIVADPRPGGDARPHRAAARHGVRALPVRGHLRAGQGRRRARGCDGAKVRYVIGNHGLEPATRLGTFERQVVQRAAAARAARSRRRRHRHRGQALLAGRALPARPREAEGARGDPPRRRRPAGPDARSSPASS